MAQAQAQVQAQHIKNPDLILDAELNTWVTKGNPWVVNVHHYVNRLSALDIARILQLLRDADVYTDMLGTDHGTGWDPRYQHISMVVKRVRVGGRMGYLLYAEWSGGSVWSASLSALLVEGKSTIWMTPEIDGAEALEAIEVILSLMLATNMTLEDTLNAVCRDEVPYVLASGAFYRSYCRR